MGTTEYVCFVHLAPKSLHILDNTVICSRQFISQIFGE